MPLRQSSRTSENTRDRARHARAIKILPLFVRARDAAAFTTSIVKERSLSELFPRCKSPARKRKSVNERKSALRVQRTDVSGND